MIKPSGYSKLNKNKRRVLQLEYRYQQRELICDAVKKFFQLVDEIKASDNKFDAYKMRIDALYGCSKVFASWHKPAENHLLMKCWFDLITYAERYRSLCEYPWRIDVISNTTILVTSAPAIKELSLNNDQEKQKEI